MRALIVADGDAPARDTLERHMGVARPDLVVAADGGALKAATLGYVADVVVGDADSLAAQAIISLREQGIEVIVHPADKDESDTQLAVREALQRGATELVIVGAFGGARLEHTLANILLLTLPELDGVDAVLVDDRSTVRLATATRPVTIEGSVGDFVSLLPLTETADGVSTDGLRFGLHDGALQQGPARGLSNELTGARASVSVGSGRLLVIHTTRNQGST